MAISYYAEEVSFPAIKKRETSEWIRRVAEKHGKKCGDIAYIFCSDGKNSCCKSRISSTTIIIQISLLFDYTQGNRISGDIFISIDTVSSNAEEYHTSLDEEIHRIIIHGILHLCGINDKGEGEREVMTAHENDALKMRFPSL